MFREHAENFPLKYNVTNIIVRICAMRIIINTRMYDDALQLTVSEKMLYLTLEKMKISVLLIFLFYRCRYFARF